MADSVVVAVTSGLASAARGSIRILEIATKSPTLRTLENVAGAFSMDVAALITSAKRLIKR